MHLLFRFFIFFWFVTAACYLNLIRVPRFEPIWSSRSDGDTHLTQNSVFCPNGRVLTVHDRTKGPVNVYVIQTDETNLDGGERIFDKLKINKIKIYKM